MSHRLNIPQRQFILREMLELARFLTVRASHRHTSKK
jgi:hypothetical protein